MARSYKCDICGKLYEKKTEDSKEFTQTLDRKRTQFVSVFRVHSYHYDIESSNNTGGVLDVCPECTIKTMEKTLQKFKSKYKTE